jgi:hypothetical protein
LRDIIPDPITVMLFVLVQEKDERIDGFLGFEMGQRPKGV